MKNIISNKGNINTKIPIIMAFNKLFEFAVADIVATFHLNGPIQSDINLEILFY